jgi:hypothetical protein
MIVKIVAVVANRASTKLTDLHATTETENKVESRFFLDVIIGKSTAIFKLLSSEDQALLVRRDALLILDLALNIVDGVAGLDLQSDGLAGD